MFHLNTNTCMKEKDYKEETFTSWLELITLLEYLALTRDEFKEIRFSCR